MEPPFTVMMGNGECVCMIGPEVKDEDYTFTMEENEDRPDLEEGTTYLNRTDVSFCTFCNYAHL